MRKGYVAEAERRYLGTPPPYPVPISATQLQAEYLDSLAALEIPKIEISIDELAEKNVLRVTLERICQNAVAVDGVELKCFGSLSTTFATKGSDMDLVLLSPHSKPELSSSESEVPRLIEKALLDAGYGAKLLTKTRVPIIKFCEKPTPEIKASMLAERQKHEIERDGILKCDTQKPKNPPVPPLDGLKNQMFPPVSVDSQLDGSLDGQITPRLMQTERADPRLLNHSDGERARLYRLAMGENWYTMAERKIIFEFIRQFERLPAPHMAAKNLQLTVARDQLLDLPNVIGKYRPPRVDAFDRLQGDMGIQCDINFSNHLGLHNSQLLKCYSLCDPRVRLMVLFVKAWAKKRNINSSYHGTLSSYGYVLMVLHYLVNIAREPVVPNLQLMELMSRQYNDEMLASEVQVDGYRVHFYRNEKTLEELQRRKNITRNDESLGSLLRGFYQYYAQQGDTVPKGGFRWTLDVLSIRTQDGLLTKQSKGWTGATTASNVRHRYLLAIEDPFETDHNIARTVVHNGIVAIRDEFRRAHRLISLQADKKPLTGPDSLFAEAADRHNLQYKAFGPLARRDKPVTQGPTGKEANPKNVRLDGKPMMKQ